MWPVSYNSTSSSDSATTRPGSSRCAATHSVVTIICGWAYSANFASGSYGNITACLTSARYLLLAAIPAAADTRNHTTHCNAPARSGLPPAISGVIGEIPRGGSYAAGVGEVRVGTASRAGRTLLESGWCPPQAG